MKELNRNDFEYIKLLLCYIEQEYENIPETVTKEMDLFLKRCAIKRELIPNAAGRFSKKFIYNNIERN